MAGMRICHTLALVVSMLAGVVTPAAARDETLIAEFKAAYPELFRPQDGGGRRATPMAVPDIFGPGAVLDVGNIHMKVTNIGVVGNPFMNLGSDPSAQWPGASGTEYMNFIIVSVGAVNRGATDPAAIRRSSYYPEWRPQTIDPEDRMYKSYDGQANGMRLADDDKDIVNHLPIEATQWIDEDFLDGRDNDGDGRIDEDYGAVGQKQWTCTMWDNTPQAVASTVGGEKHVPLNLEMRQTAFAYSVPGFENFNVVTWTIYNRSGHGLDSMYVGLRTDIDGGPLDSPTYFSDDIDVPFFPFGDFKVVLSPDNEWGKKLDPKGNRRQQNHDIIASVPADSALCPAVTLRVNGFSVADNDGDLGRTKGMGSVMLLGHTIDPRGVMAPRKVGWHGFRSYVFGTPYNSGGNPATDQQRSEMFESPRGINPETGFIDVTPVDQEGDIQEWAMVGPFGVSDETGTPHPIPDGGSIEVTIAFGVAECDLQKANQYPADYQAYLDNRLSAKDLFDKYPPLRNAFAAQVAYEGVYDVPPTELSGSDNINTTDYHGRETRVIAPVGFILSDSDCRDEGAQRQIDEFGYTWFDFDCDYCTGVWAFGSGQGGGTGLYLRRWNTAAPPPNPNLNVGVAYNFRDNPDRVVTPAGDEQATIAWDNLSEVTVDPEKGHFDFRSYRIWKVSNWLRPVGAAGPADDDWSLIGHFRFFDYRDSNIERFADSTMVKGGFWPPARDSVNVGNAAICPQVFIPNLSLQTLVLDKSRFDASSAANWVQTSQATLGRQLRYGPGDMSETGTAFRFRQSDGECKIGTFRTVEVDHGVTAEVCSNPLSEARGFRVPVCLFKNDLWDPQNGDMLRVSPETCPQRAPDGTCLVDTIPCVLENGVCKQERGKVVDTEDQFIFRTRYPVGRYRFVDREVKNGFLYFYSVSAGDSTSNGTIDTRDDELAARRAAVEAEAVVPQEATRTTPSVWVVPNPYRGYAELSRRPSSWDLTPNSTDPTGTHVDFLGLPPGQWSLSIYTVSGDLVQTLRSEDEINASVRGPAVVRNPNYNPSLPPDPVLNPTTITVPGYNRQQDNPNDGQARWNLISRNGQDIVSGVYLFVVDSSIGTQRGKFVIIR